MEVKVKDLMLAFEILHRVRAEKRVSKANIPNKTRVMFRVNDLTDTLGKTYEALHKLRMEYIQKYGVQLPEQEEDPKNPGKLIDKLGPDGQVVMSDAWSVPEDKMEDFRKDWEPVAEESKKLGSAQPLKLSLFDKGDAIFDEEELRAMGPFVVDDETK